MYLVVNAPWMSEIFTNFEKKIWQHLPCPEHNMNTAPSVDAGSGEGREGIIYEHISTGSCDDPVLLLSHLHRLQPATGAKGPWAH